MFIKSTFLRAADNSLETFLPPLLQSRARDGTEPRTRARLGQLMSCICVAAEERRQVASVNINIKS